MTVNELYQQFISEAYKEIAEKLSLQGTYVDPALRDLGHWRDDDVEAVVRFLRQLPPLFPSRWDFTS